MSIDGWMGKANVVSTYNEQFSLKKREKETLQYVTIWMSLEDIMLSERFETEGHHDMTPLT